jgi:D-arabinose 1-dehydrogenase-like Zn-dependent alcohol dehydrogenase
VLQLAAEGKLKCRIERHRLPEIDAIFEEMKNGRIVGRVVLEF